MLKVKGKQIFVEVERARLTRILSKIKEEEGDVIEAANILQELQVETYGSMEKREKTDFILEQMRLCLLKKDFTRAQIISRKISTRFFEDEKNEVFSVSLIIRIIDNFKNSFTSLTQKGPEIEILRSHD